MILSVGEILADIVNVEQNNYKLNLGGAPFNLAVNAKNNGSKVGFIGSVGKDVVGDNLIGQAKKFNLDYLSLGQSKCNTTLAFVVLKEGERDFSFFRTNTADYKIDYKSINLAEFKDLQILHLGSLMLNKKHGREVVKNLIEQAKALGIKVSFDVNLRDIFTSKKQAIKCYQYALDNSDIIKLSQEELVFFTGEFDLLKGITSLARKNVLYVISQGAKGSFCYYNDKGYFMPTFKVVPVDTTGAGDAFYGTFLSMIEGREYGEKTLTEALKKANKVGAETTLFYGALKG